MWQIWWLCPELLAQMDSGLYVCGNSTIDPIRREAWVEDRVEYHRTHWRNFKEKYVEYFEALAASTSNEGSTLDATGTGLIPDCYMRDHYAQRTHALWHYG